MAELIIGGILDLVAADLQISVSTAGLSITVFAFMFAISAPVLLLIFSRVERKRLALIGLIVFFIGNIIAIISFSFSMLIISRIVSAASGSLVVVLCINLAATIVEEAYRGRAIGLVVMGTSASIVLGLPLGVFLGYMYEWRSPFILIACLTLILIFAVFFFMEQVPPRPVISLRKQLRTLKNKRLLFGHLTTFFFLSGHFILYGFLTPYSKTMLNFSGTMISILYLIYGIAAVSGGGLGGMMADRIGIKRTVYAVIIALALCLFVIPFTVTVPLLFWIILIGWGIMSWGITPPIQSHILQLAPETSDIQQSLNNAAQHLGIAFGTFVGSMIIYYSSIINNPFVGGLFVLLAFISAIISLRGQVIPLKDRPI